MSDAIVWRPTLFSAPMVLALLAGTKTQTRRVITAANSLVDGVVLTKQWRRLDFDQALVDRGPSPAGNPGPYLKAPVRRGDTTHRVYPRVQAGDRLWVREAWMTSASHDHRPPRDIPGDAPLLYLADGGSTGRVGEHGRYRHGRFMPRWASRITLEVMGVRVERLHDISEADAIAEGMPSRSRRQGETARAEYATLWESLNPTNAAGPQVTSLGGFVTAAGEDAGASVSAASWAANPWVWAVEFKRVQP